MLAPARLLGRPWETRAGFVGMLSNPVWVEETVEAHHHCPDVGSRLRLAVELARENVMCRTGGPFAAVVVDEETGEVVAAGVNGVERLRNSLAHAEAIALAAAERRLGTYSLRASNRRLGLYSSSEPCAMCLGAVLWSGVARVVYAAPREDAEAIGFDEGPPAGDSLAYLRERGIMVEPGPLRAEAGAVLRLYVELGGTVYNA
jgi:tRNA(Arg) A34 adenosine deaminase TadA